MRILSALFALLPFSSFAVLHIVQSGGSTIGSTDPYYSPQFLTINVGDQVRWENQSGTHNVNGTLTTFPSNPQGFTSGDTQSGNWTWTFTFTIPGVYNYHCDGNGHAATQFGAITVVDPTGLARVGESRDGSSHTGNGAIGRESQRRAGAGVGHYQPEWRSGPGVGSGDRRNDDPGCERVEARELLPADHRP